MKQKGEETMSCNLDNSKIVWVKKKKKFKIKLVYLKEIFFSTCKDYWKDCMKIQGIMLAKNGLIPIYLHTRNDS